jgi:hypothetical protein
VIRHYGFYHHHVYLDHCYHWTYDPYYHPRISKFRIRHDNGRYYTYNVHNKRREFSRRNSIGLSAERVRYRGKEEIKYTYNKSRSNDGAKRTVTRNGVSSPESRRSIEKRSSTERSVTKTSKERSDLRKTSSVKREQNNSGSRSRTYERSKTTSRSAEKAVRNTASSRSREYTKKSLSRSSRLSKIGNAIKRSVPKVSREIKKANTRSKKSSPSVKKTSNSKKSASKTKKVTKKKGG